MVYFSLKQTLGGTLLASLLFLCVPQSLPGEPPFSGTIFVDPDIITENDPTTYLSLADGGQGQRTIWKYFLRSGSAKSLFNYSTGSCESF